MIERVLRYAELLRAFDDHNLLCGAHPGLDDGECGCIVKTTDNCADIILALVDVVEQVKQDMFNCYDCSEPAIYVTRDSASVSSFICENCIADWERDEIIKKLGTPNALTTADEKIGEILGRDHDTQD